MAESNQTDQQEHMLGALVDKDLYWKFKQTAFNRQETMAAAVAHAARLYLEIDTSKEGIPNV